MKKYFYTFVSLLIMCVSQIVPSNAFAKSLKQSADSLGSNLTSISLSLATAAIMLCAICFYLGKNDATERLGRVLGGVFLTVASVSVINFFKTIA